jgi:hypothetical protein
MAAKLMFCENCQFQLYFGVFESQDLILIKLLIKYFKNKKISTSHPFDFDQKLYEDLLALTNTSFKKRKCDANLTNDLIQIDDEKLKYYKNVLEATYIGLGDQIFEKIENRFDSNNFALMSAIKKMDEFNLLDRDKL